MYVTSTRYFDRLNAEQLRVLVVEPKELVAARLKTQLERLGHLVLGPAKDGQEAVAVAQRLHPSLVLIDSKLPGGDGIETARAIRSEEHTSELQSPYDLVCRLLLEKKKQKKTKVQ